MDKRRVVQDLINRGCEQDPRTAMNMPIRLSEFLQRYYRTLYEGSEYYRDAQARVIEYVAKTLVKLLWEPATKLKREYTEVPIEKARFGSTNALLGVMRLPGRTIREKLAGRRKVKDIRKVRSVDLPENRAVVGLAARILDVINLREDLRWAFAWLEDEIERALRKGPLAGLEGGRPIAVNRLLFHPLYMRIRKAWELLDRYEQQNVDFDFSYLVGLGIVAKAFVEGRIRPVDCIVWPQDGMDHDGYRVGLYRFDEQRASWKWLDAIEFFDGRKIATWRLGQEVFEAGDGEDFRMVLKDAVERGWSRFRGMRELRSGLKDEEKGVWAKVAVDSFTFDGYYDFGRVVLPFGRRTRGLQRQKWDEIRTKDGKKLPRVFVAALGYAISSKLEVRERFWVVDVLEDQPVAREFEVVSNRRIQESRPKERAVLLRLESEFEPEGIHNGAEYVQWRVENYLKEKGVGEDVVESVSDVFEKNPLAFEWVRREGLIVVDGQGKWVEVERQWAREVMKTFKRMAQEALRPIQKRRGDKEVKVLFVGNPLIRDWRVPVIGHSDLEVGLKEAEERIRERLPLWVTRRLRLHIEVIRGGRFELFEVVPRQEQEWSYGDVIKIQKKISANGNIISAGWISSGPRLYRCDGCEQGIEEIEARYVAGKSRDWEIRIEDVEVIPTIWEPVRGRDYWSNDIINEVAQTRLWRSKVAYGIFDDELFLDNKKGWSSDRFLDIGYQEWGDFIYAMNKRIEELDRRFDPKLRTETLDMGAVEIWATKGERCKNTKRFLDYTDNSLRNMWKRLNEGDDRRKFYRPFGTALRYIIAVATYCRNKIPGIVAWKLARLVRLVDGLLEGIDEEKMWYWMYKNPFILPSRCNRHDIMLTEMARVAVCLLVGDVPFDFLRIQDGKEGVWAY